MKDSLFRSTIFLDGLAMQRNRSLPIAPRVTYTWAGFTSSVFTPAKNSKVPEVHNPGRGAVTIDREG
jgi:hypothetical protein